MAPRILLGFSFSRRSDRGGPSTYARRLETPVDLAHLSRFAVVRCWLAGLQGQQVQRELVGRRLSLLLVLRHAERRASVAADAASSAGSAAISPSSAAIPLPDRRVDRSVGRTIEVGELPQPVRDRRSIESRPRFRPPQPLRRSRAGPCRASAAGHRPDRRRASRSTPPTARRWSARPSGTGCPSARNQRGDRRVRAWRPRRRRASLSKPPRGRGPGPGATGRRSGARARRSRSGCTWSSRFLTGTARRKQSPSPWRYIRTMISVGVSGTSGAAARPPAERFGRLRCRSSDATSVFCSSQYVPGCSRASVPARMAPACAGPARVVGQPEAGNRLAALRRHSSRRNAICRAFRPRSSMFFATEYVTRPLLGIDDERGPASKPERQRLPVRARMTDFGSSGSARSSSARAAPARPRARLSTGRPPGGAPWAGPCALRAGSASLRSRHPFEADAQVPADALLSPGPNWLAPCAIHPFRKRANIRSTR